MPGPDSSYSSLVIHLPRDVDHQGRVRRVWPRHRPPQVLLSVYFERRKHPRRWKGCRLSDFRWQPVKAAKDFERKKRPRPRRGVLWPVALRLSAASAVHENLMENPGNNIIAATLRATK